MNKLISPGPVWQSTGLALIRVIVGLMMVYHGWEIFDSEKMNGYMTWDKFKSPSSTFLVYAGKGAELVGGILLTLGLLTKIAGLMIAGTLLYIAFFVGNGKIWYEDQHPFLFVLLGLVFFFCGPGAFSLDRIFFREAGFKSKYK